MCLETSRSHLFEVVPFKTLGHQSIITKQKLTERDNI